MPPIFGGKSLVTSRWWVTSAPPAARDVAVELGPRPSGRASARQDRRRPSVDRQVVAAEAARRPAPRGPARCGSASARAPSTAARTDAATLGRRRHVAGVAQHDERVAAQVARLAVRRCTSGRSGRAASSSSAASRSSTSTHGPGSSASAGRAGSASARRRRARRRAHLLAVVAAVEAVAERDAVLDREHAVGLHEPGQAAAGVDDAGADDGAGRAAVDAAAARAAAVGHRLGRRRAAARR